MVSKYDYESLRKRATKSDATQDDINRLGEWFESYGMNFWNGEYYDADGFKLFPVYTFDSEAEEYSFTDNYEIKED